MRWFRFYHEALDDPKVQRLSPELFKSWVNLLCVAAKNGGSIPDNLEDLAFTMRMSMQKLGMQVEGLIAADLLDRDETLHPHNWAERQYASDDVNARVKRFRERKSNDTDNVACNVTETVDETPPDTDTDTDTEQNREDIPARAFSMFVDLAKQCGLSVPSKLDTDRRAKLVQRLKEAGGLEGWGFAIAKIRGAPFLLGKNKDGFKASFDFVLQRKSFRKLMEGGFDASGPQLTNGWAAVLAEIGASAADRDDFSGDGQGRTIENGPVGSA